MVNLRDLAALALLAQLMTMSRGTDIKEIGVIEEILPKNVSIFTTDGKTDDHSDTTIRNVTTINIDPIISNDNNSMILDALIKKEKMLEAELEGVIEGAAASGQVILISPPADKINSTKEPPVIVIETIEAESLKSVINNTSSDKMIEETIPSIDQEIAQSRIHKRSVSTNYDDSENSENLEDLLAVTDYEPQKLDAKNVEEKSSQTPSDVVNSQDKTTKPPIEKIHYDVPKGRNNPKKLQIILSDVYRTPTTKPDLKVSSTDQVPLATLSSELDPIEIEQKKIEAERKLLSTPSTFYHKPIAVFSEPLRDRRHPRIGAATTKPSLPIRVAYGSVPPRINPLTVSSAIDVSPTLVPDFSRNGKSQLRYNYNLITVAEPLKKNVRSRVGAIPTLVTPNHRSASENETISIGDKLIESDGAQANRRIDYYLTPQYLASLKPNNQLIANNQLGYLTRYNQPSLLTGNPRLPPVVPTHRQTGSPNGSWRSIPGTPDPSRSSIITHPRDSYDLQGKKIASRPPTGDYHKDGRAVTLKTTPVYNSYEESEEETKPNSQRPENGDYQRIRNRPQPSTPSAYDSYEETDKEIAPNNQRQENADYQRNRNQPLASTTPTDESYEEDEEETDPKDRREENSDRPVNRNRQHVSTTPFNNFYEDYQQSVNPKIANASPTVSYENYKDSAEDLKTVKNSAESSDEVYTESESSKTDSSSPTTLYNDYKNSAENVETVKNLPESSYEDDEESESSKTASDSPTTLYNDYKNSAENVETEKNSPESSYEEYKESESSNADRNSPTWSYDDYKNAKIGDDSSTDSYKESESSDSVRNSPTWSYDDYKNAKIGDYSSTIPYDHYEDSEENSKAVSNSPSASHEDSKESDGNSKIIRNPPVSSYEDYEESDSTKVIRSTRSPIVSTTPVDGSYEDYKESRSAKSLKKSPDVPSTAASNPYESSEQFDHRKLVPQLQRLIPNSVQQRQRLSINSHPVSTHPSNNYPARPIQPVTPITSLNNPIYQLHGLKTTAIMKDVYNPYVNYSTRKPSRPVSYDRQNTQSPPATVTGQRIVYTTPAYNSPEYTAQANNPSIAIPRITNPKYPDHQIAKTSYSNIKKNIENASIAPEKKNADYGYRQRVGSPYAVIPSNTISPLPPQGILQPQRNLHRAISRVSSPAHVESIDNGNEYDESIVRRPYATETRKLRDPKASQYPEANNPPTSSRSTPEYDSYESDDREISPSPTSPTQLNEPQSPDYGNRIKTKVPEKQRDRVVAPLNSEALTTTPTSQSNIKTPVLNYENRRPVSIHGDGVPVELVNRPNARISSEHGDEVPAGSGHDEKHEKHETHEAAKKEHHGGDHKHEEGGGEEHEEGHHRSHGEKGDKGYKSWHEHDKAKKGHHDKESHEKEYEEKKGDKKKHEEESDYHKEHHHEEKGNKEAKFEEKGEHQKGHSTKGQHVVHKKDEFEKKVEFYDESHEESSEEKEGEHHGHHESEKGGHEKFAHHDSAHHEEKHGKKGEHEKGHHYHEDKGHKESDGHEKHHHHKEKYGKKGGREEGKKWSHKKGDNGKKDS